MINTILRFFSPRFIKVTILFFLTLHTDTNNLTDDDVRSRLQAERARGECALAQQAGALAAARRARAQLQAQHERERAALRERARTLQRRLAALDSEYSAQLDSLRAAYQVGIEVIHEGL